MRAVLRLVESPHAQGTNVARPMIARSNRIVHNGIRTNKADLGIRVRSSKGLGIVSCGGFGRGFRYGL